MGFIKGIEDKYPSEILLNRMNIEGSVIGALKKELILIDETSLEVSDFITSEGRCFFKVMKDARKQGYNEIDEVTVLSTISGALADKFNEYGGYDSLYNLSEIVDLKNSDSIFDALHRENIIMSLYDSGFNLTKPLTDDNGKEYIPLDKFRKMNSEDIISYYEVELNKYAIGYNTKVLEERKLNVTDEYINTVESGELNGVPFEVCSIDEEGGVETVYPYLSRDIKGMIRGSTSILGAYSSVGKTSYWTGMILSFVERGEKVLIFSNEQDGNVFINNFLVWLSYKHFRYTKLTKSKLKSGNLTEDDSKMLREVSKYFNENYADNIMFIHLPDMDINTIKKKTRTYCLKEGYSVVLIDTLKQDYTDGTADASYHKLIQDTRTIDAMAKKYELIMLCSFQLAPSTLGKLFLDVTCLSGAKATKDILENLFLMRIVYDEELDKTSRLYCKPYQNKRCEDEDEDGNTIYDDNGKPKMVWKQIPYEVDESKTYRMLFTDKCRSGTMSGDSGIAMLLEFDAVHSVFKEVAYCKPKRGVVN